jgi:hypothetical protein
MPSVSIFNYRLGGVKIDQTVQTHQEGLDADPHLCPKCQEEMRIAAPIEQRAHRNVRFRLPANAPERQKRFPITKYIKSWVIKLMQVNYGGCTTFTESGDIEPLAVEMRKN